MGKQALLYGGTWYKRRMYTTLSFLIIFQYLLNPFINISFADDINLQESPPAAEENVSVISETPDQLDDQGSVPSEDQSAAINQNADVTETSEATTATDDAGIMTPETSSTSDADTGEQNLSMIDEVSVGDTEGETGIDLVNAISQENTQDIINGALGENTVTNDTGSQDTLSGDTMNVEVDNSISDTGSQDVLSGEVSTYEENVSTSNSLIEIIVSENAVGFLRLRAEANSNSEVLAEIPIGTILSTNISSGDFYFVEFEGKKGRVSKEYVHTNSEFQDEETTEFIEPIGKLKQAQGKVLLSSLDSFNFISNKTTYCSYITRLNLERLTGLPSIMGLSKDNQNISKGDAYYLIQDGKRNNQFQTFNRENVTSLLGSNEHSQFSVFDAYSYHNTMEADVLEEKGHRFIIIKASDGAYYVLDPVVSNSTKPIPLDEYLQGDRYSSDFYLLRGYTLSQTIPSLQNGLDVIIDNLKPGEFQNVSEEGEGIWIYKVALFGDRDLLMNKFSSQEHKLLSGLKVVNMKGEELSNNVELEKDEVYLLGYDKEQILSLLGRTVFGFNYGEIKSLDDLEASLSGDTATLGKESLGESFRVFLDQGKIVVKLLENTVEGYKEGEAITKKDALKAIIESDTSLSDIKNDVIDIIKNEYSHDNASGEKEIQIDNTIIDNVSETIIEKKIESTEDINLKIDIQGEKNLNFDENNISFQAGSLEAVIDPVNLEPGTYTISFSYTNPITNEVQNFEQDFSRGVIAINSDKDVYKPGDTIQLDIATLDSLGYPSCDAEVAGSVTRPDGSILALQIIKNPDCGKLEAGYIVPDYESSFGTDATGDYFIQLKVTTADGERTLTQRVQVVQDSAVTITRESATRNYPFGNTPMGISLDFAVDYQGIVTEYLPDSFEITNVSDNGIVGSSNGYKTITWNIDVAAGGSKILQYSFDAPNTSPDFFVLGSMTLGNNLNNEVYTEKRLRQIANDEYTQNNNIGEFILTTITNFIGMDLSNTLNVIGDTSLGVMRLNGSATTGYFQTIDINPSSMYGRQALTWSGTGNPTSLEIRDCTNAIITTVASPSSPVSLSGISALSGVECIRVRMYLVGNSSSPQFSQVKVTRDPEPIMSLNISGPATMNAGACMDYTISRQNSFVDDTGAVLYIQLPSRANGTIYNYTSGYNQYSGGNYYDPYLSPGYYGVGAPYFNPLGLPISFNGKYTSTAIMVNNTSVPANSIYRNLGFVSAGTTANYKFLLCARVGTQSGTTFTLNGLIDGFLSSTGTDNYITNIASIPGKASSSSMGNTYSCDGAFKLSQYSSNKVVNYSHYVQNRNGGSQNETIFNPFVDLDFTDIINDLQSSCGASGYSGAISRFTFTTLGGSRSGNVYKYPSTSFQSGWLIPSAVQYFYFNIDYTGCTTSGTAFTYTGTFDGDNITPLVVPRTLTIGECIVQVGSFNKFPTFTSLPYNYGQTIPYTLQFNNQNGDRKGMIIMYDKIPAETYLASSGTFGGGVTGYVYYSTVGAGNAWNNPPARDTGTMFSGNAGPNRTTTYTSGAIWIMTAIPHMNSILFPITTGSYVGIPYYSSFNFSAGIKSTGACSIIVKNTGAYEIRQRTLSPESYDTGLVILTTPISGYAISNLPAVPDEIRPVIQNIAPNNWFNPYYPLGYSVTDFLGMGTYTQTGQFAMTGLDGSFTGTLTIPFPLLNINGVPMYPTVASVTLIRNGSLFTDYSSVANTTGGISGNNSLVLSFSGLETGTYQFGVKLNIPHGFFQGGTTTILLSGSNSCANYSGKSQLSISPIQGSQIIQAFKITETPISFPDGIIQYNMNTQSLGRWYTTNTFIIDKIPANTTFVDAQTSGITTNLQTFDCSGCRVYFYSGASIPATPTSGFIFSNFVLGNNAGGVRTSPFPASQVTYVAYKIDNPNTIPPNVFPVGTGNRVGMRVQVSSGATDGLVINNEYKVISDQLLPTNSNKVETIISTINLRDLILTKSGYSAGLDNTIGTIDDYTGSALVNNDVRYTLTYYSNSSSGASGAYITDPIPANTCFKVGSLANINPPILHSFSYSNDGGLTFSYSPTGIYDCSVTDIRIDFNQAINPGRLGRFRFDVKINASFTGTSISNTAIIHRSGTELNLANNTGVNTLPLYRSDLYINKSVNKTLTYPLDTLSYTLDYGNLGPNIATSVVITDTFPVGFIYGSSTPSGIISGNQIIFTTGSLLVGQTGRITINGSISGGLISGTYLNNTGSITSLSNDSNTGNNVSTTGTLVRDRLSDLAIVKTPSILTGLTGATLNYTIQYRNRGPDSAPNVIISDVLPTGFNYTSSSPAGIKVGNTITWTSGQIGTLGTLNVGFTGTITVFGSISGAAQSGDLLTNVVQIATTSETNTGNNISTGITLVRSKLVDLVITKAVNLTGAYTGNNLTYTLQYRNYGPDNGVNVTISDTLPTGFVYTSSSPAGILSGNTLTWTSGQIAAFANYGLGSTGTITINGTVSGSAQSGDILFNQVIITNDVLEANQNNNSGSASTLIKGRFADLSITKTPSITTGYAGNTLNYTIQYKNRGVDFSPNTVISDTLPTGFVYTSSSPAGILSGNVLTWTSGQIAAFANLGTGATGSITIFGSISGTMNGNQRLHNVVSISGNYFDPNTGNNQATGSTYIPPKADLRVIKTQSTGIVFSGDYLSYTISYYNSGLDTGNNVVITDTWPSGLLFISASTGYSFVPANKYLFTVPVLPVGITGTITLTGLVLGGISGTRIGNSVLITGSEFDPNTGNNGTGVTGTLITPYFDLELDKNLLNSSTVYVGQQVGFKITVFNKGPFTGYNITVSDLLPIGINYFIHSLSQGTYDPIQGLWTIGTLGYMQGADIYITGTMMTGGVITNYAQIVGYSGGIDIDSTGANNSGTGGNADEDDDDTVPVTGVRPADVTVWKTASARSGHTGDVISFSINYRNKGTGSASNVIITDLLPAGLLYLSSFPAGVIAGPTITRSSGQIAALANLAPGASGSINLNAQIRSGALSGQILTNNVSISTTTPETNTGNNTGSATVLVKQWLTDLEITKEVDLLTGYAGDSLKYIIRYNNNGPDAGLNTVVTDVLPTGFVYDYSVPAGVLSGNTLTWASGEIPIFHQKFFSGDSGYIVIYGSIDPSYPGNQWLHNGVTITSTINESNTGNNQDTGSTRVLPVADLGIKKGQSSDIVYSGDIMAYTLTYYNNGKDTGTNVTITDHRPINELQFISASIPHSFSGPNFYSFVIPTLGPGEWGEIIISGLVLSTISGTNIGNYAMISGNELDPDRSNNETKINAITNDPYFDLELDKNLLNSSTVYVGQQVGFKITVFNKGPFTGYNITVSDLLPIGINYFIHSLSQGTYDPIQGLWTIGTLGYMQGADIYITGTMMTGGVITNYAQIVGYSGGVDIDSTGGNNSGTGGNADEDDDDTVPVTGVRPADVTVWKTASLAQVHAGEPISFTVHYANNGTGNANNVQIIDTLPSGFTYISSSPSGTIAGSTLTRSSGQIAGLGVLGSQMTGSIVITGIIGTGIASGSLITNNVAINTTSLETNTGNNTGTVSVIVIPRISDIRITKEASAMTGYAGDVISYSIRYYNAGPDSGENVVITDTLPAGYEYLTSSPLALLSGNTLTWTSGQIAGLGSLGTGYTGLITVFGSFSGGATGNQYYHNTVSITGTTLDTDTGNNQATGSVRLNPKADLSVLKYQSTGIFYEGDYISYTLIYTNNGRDTGTNVIVSDYRPAGLQFFSASLPHNFSGPNQYSFFIPELIAGASGSITLTGIVLGGISGTLIKNIAFISGHELDPITGNNSSGVSGILQDKTIDLELSKVINNSGAIYLNQVIGYTITVINKGPFTGYNIFVEELLPVGLQYLSHQSSQGLYDQSHGLWLIGTLGVMQSVTLTISGVVNKTGSITNYSQVWSYSGGIDIDSTGANNSGTGSNADEDDDDIVTTTVLDLANVQITKKANIQTGVLGGSVSRIIEYANNGFGTAHNVVIMDFIPNGLLFSGSTITGTATTLTLSGDIGYEFLLGSLLPGQTGSITISTKIVSGYNTQYTNNVIISTTTPETTTGDNTAGSTLPIISSFLGLVDPYTCGGNIYGRITNTGNGVEYVKIILMNNGTGYKTFTPSLDANNNFAIIIDYGNPNATNYVAAGDYSIAYELKELSGKSISGSYTASIKNICGGGGGSGPTPRCGDGIVQANLGEQCEPGQTLSGGVQCTASCKLSGPYCGDGIVDTSRGEACEASTFSMTGKSCNASCQIINNQNPYCGDGIIQSNLGEQCETPGSDLGNLWQCNASCKAVRIINNIDPIHFATQIATDIIHHAADDITKVIILPKTGADY